MLERAVQGTLVFKDLSTLAMSTTNKSGHEIYLGPLKRWTNRAHEIPMIAPLSRRVLRITSSQAKSERLFSIAGVINNHEKAKLIWRGQRKGSREPENSSTAVQRRKSQERQHQLVEIFLRCSFVHILPTGPKYRYRYRYRYFFLGSRRICSQFGADGVWAESVSSK